MTAFFIVVERNIISEINCSCSNISRVDQGGDRYPAGNIVVNGANVGTPGSRIDVTAPIGIPLSAKVLPNPSQAYFTLWLNGTLDQAIDVKVFDAVGRQVTAMKSEAGQSVQFGSTYPAGVYTIRLQQGMQIVSIPVVKQ